MRPGAAGGTPGRTPDAAPGAAVGGADRRGIPWSPIFALLFGAAGPLLLGDGRSPVALAAWGVLTVAAAAVLAWRRRWRRSERRAAEESLRRLHQAQKLEAVGRLAGGLAHDVNNYLAVIRSHCESVLARDLPRPQVEEKMRAIVQAVLRASSLVERLLAFGRRQPTRAEPVDLNPVVESYLQVMGGGGGVEVAARLAPDLWPVKVDLSQIEQVVANLVVNARDASPAAARVEVVTVNLPAAGEEGDRVALEVVDHGHGIPPELRERIFEPFFTTRAGRGASGLGLSTVHGIVAEAGGRVEVEDTPGGGTTFRAVLPRTLEAPAPAAEVRDLLEGTERLLLVDDNRELAAAVAAYLGDLGYRVSAVPSAAAALAAAEEARRDGDPFELVVTDVQLGAGRPGGPVRVGEGRPGGPGVESTPSAAATGPELVERLRAGGDAVKALYMTGYTERIVLRSVDRDDEAYFVKKPFSLEGLARLVRGLLDVGLEVEPP